MGQAPKVNTGGEGCVYLGYIKQTLGGKLIFVQFLAHPNILYKRLNRLVGEIK
jgi:hypothetical protein